MIKPTKQRAKVGTKISFGNGELTAVVKEELEHGGRIVEFEYDGIFLEVLESLGKCHYHHTSRKNWTILKCIKQFILKKSVLPLLLPAGLHFTEELLAKIEAKGVKLVYLTLHVGLGTFRPVSVDNIEEHKMHSEFYRLSEEAAKTLNEVRQMVVGS